MKELLDKQEILTKAKNLCEGCYLMEHCGQCNPDCRLRQAIDMIEGSSFVSMIPEKPAEDGESEINNSDEWWKNYIRSRMSQDDVPDIRVGKTDFQPGDKFILELGQERRMFDEFEIAGTDLYVETRLLEKLKRYEPENKLDSAQPEPPRAYWIRGKYSWDDYHYNDTSYKCSRCGKVDANIPRYCPGCGAKMEEEIR